MSDDILLDDITSDQGGSGFTDNDEQTLVTKEGLKKLKEELEFLKTTRRQEVAQRLKEAISYGDLSENSEYEEAKNEQAFVEGRIHNVFADGGSLRMIPLTFGINIKP